MTPLDVIQTLAEHPFEPWRIALTNGEAILIGSSEAASRSESPLLVVVDRDRRTHYVNPDAIARLTPLARRPA